PAAGHTNYLAGVVLRARAAAMQMLGDSAGAKASMKRSLSILSDYDGAMTAARLALMQGDYDTADTQADAALKLKPGKMEVRMLKIDVALQKGNFLAAQQAADRLEADNPNSASALLMRVKTYVVSNRSDVVEPEVDRLLAKAPDIVIARYF